MRVSYKLGITLLSNINILHRPLNINAFIDPDGIMSDMAMINLHQQD